MLRLLAPGAAASAAILLLVGAAFAGLVTAGGGVALRSLWGDAYVLGVLRFSVVEASLSALLSVGLAVPAARALARRPSFPGRRLLVRLLGLPMVVPTIVGVLGIVAVYGRSGLVNDALRGLGLDLRLDIYGLGGILIAHVFFNMPFAIRLLLQGWAAIPGESWRLAAQLGMSGGQILRLIEGPMLRQVLPGIAGLVFLLCFTSFAVVLALGGGPPNATLEVAIFQALRFDFDLARVAALALLQIATCLALVAAVQWLARPVAVEAGAGWRVDRPDTAALPGRIADAAAIALVLVVLLAPLAAVAAAGLGGPVGRVLADPSVWRAAARSLAVGAVAGALALSLGWGLLATSRSLRARLYRGRAADLLETGASVVLVVPPVAVGAGLFICLRPVADVLALGLVLVVLVNALMGLPFVVRILGVPATEAVARYGRLCDSLGMRGRDRFRLVDWPLLRRPAGLAFALAATLAAGDLGAISLFGTSETATLPLLLYQQMGSYRVGEAAVTALLLVALVLGLFWIIERGMGGRAVP